MPEMTSTEDASDDGKVLHDQGIWRKQKNVACKATSFQRGFSAEEKTEKAFANFEDANDKLGLEGTEEFKEFWKSHHKQEWTMPMLLADRKNGYKTLPLRRQSRPRRCGHGAAHEIESKGTAAPQAQVSPFRGRLSDLLRSMCCDMDPIYTRHVVFRPGDIRSTLDDRQMEKVTRRKSGTYHWKRGRVLLLHLCTHPEPGQLHSRSQALCSLCIRRSHRLSRQWRESSKGTSFHAARSWVSL